MKRSYVAALVTAALGLLSMGFLGAALYALALPVLWPLYGDPDRWSGDNVWPAMIGAGVLWSISFVVGGWSRPAGRPGRGAGCMCWFCGWARR